MINNIDIDVSRVPYEFQIDLSNREYTFNINYNSSFDYFTMDLKLGDEVLVLGEKLSLGIPMFNQLKDDANGNQDTRFFTETIYPADPSGTETDISIDNLNRTVFLFLFDESELA